MPRSDQGSRVWSLGVPIVLLLAGFLFAAGANTARGTDLRGSDSADLVDVIRRRSVDVERRSAAIADLQSEIDSLSAANRPDSAELAAVRNKRLGLDLTAGSGAVRGPGITVMLNDAALSKGLPAGATADDVIVHQQDVQGVVNALWAGGAEAMAIQDQRIVATSAVRCVGNTLVLRGRVYSPPFVVRAIGPVSRMRTRLDTDPIVLTYRQFADRFGLGYEAAESPGMTLPAAGGEVQFTHAQRQS